MSSTTHLSIPKSESSLVQSRSSHEDGERSKLRQNDGDEPADMSISARMPFPTVVMPGGGRLAIYPGPKMRHPGPGWGVGAGVSWTCLICPDLGCRRNNIDVRGHGHGQWSALSPIALRLSNC